ncbi:Cyclic nucleotide-binding domain protein [Rubripirellula amarantea]|uniref:Cyclic nucleotide-binding domain protein n=1 Tax=Rubripirellula amarantea TaxID=2527999 RepID=A0A5C5WBN0_9BACT|nr:Crp/Fnr family transcriptional regulator [Rubripirellula amarantea]TWT48044.1 Cyclic nucleotide-binding domain protein [Rubripirellula amarantea]
MDTHQLKFILEELRFSAALPDEMLQQIACISSLQTFAIGSLVFRESAIVRDLFLVRRGRLALEMLVPQRGAVRIVTIGPGEMAGWSALLSEGRMTASAIAIEEVEAVVAPAKQLHDLCEANHEFGYRLMHQMADALSKRLVATRLQMLDLFADHTSTSNATSGKPMSDA